MRRDLDLVLLALIAGIGIAEAVGGVILGDRGMVVRGVVIVASAAIIRVRAARR